MEGRMEERTEERMEGRMEATEGDAGFTKMFTHHAAFHVMMH